MSSINLAEKLATFEGHWHVNEVSVRVVRGVRAVSLGVLTLSMSAGALAAQVRLPVLDMHMHARGAAHYGARGCRYARR